MGVVKKWIKHQQFHWCVVSGVNKGLSQGGNFAEGVLLATVEGPLANTQRKSWEMVVNPDMDICTKHRNCRKILGKTQKKRALHQRDTKHQNVRLMGVAFLNLSCQGVRSHFCRTYAIYATVLWSGQSLQQPDLHVFFQIHVFLTLYVKLLTRSSISD